LKGQPVPATDDRDFFTGRSPDDAGFESYITTIYHPLNIDISECM